MKILDIFKPRVAQRVETQHAYRPSYESIVGPLDVPNSGIFAGERSLGPISKAAASDNLSKSALVGEPISDPKAVYADPFVMLEQLGFREKTSTVTYETLRNMTWKMPIIHAIIQTRINQVSAFATPQRLRYETGFRIKLRDSEAQPTPADRKFIKYLEDHIQRSGTAGDPRTRDSFETFLRKIVRDSLMYDQMCVEFVPDRKGRPAQWLAADASQFRLANVRELHPVDDIDAVHVVQVKDNQVIDQFTRREMAFKVRNPTTDIRSLGYGISELEMLVSTVTALLWAWQYNMNAFSQGSLQKGILNLRGSIPDNQLRQFRAQWYSQLSGVSNAWRTPIVNADAIEWMNLQNSAKDMEFSAWMDFLIKIACSVFSIDPIEVNFKYGTQNAKGMFGESNKQKLVESKDRGLKPLLRFIGRFIEEYIIWPIDPNFSFEFVGLDAQLPKEMQDILTQRVRTIYTVNDIRKELDLESLGPRGDIILDPTFLRHTEMTEEKEKSEQAEADTQAQLAALPGHGLSDEELARVARAIARPKAAPGSAMPKPAAPEAHAQSPSKPKPGAVKKSFKMDL
jgi:hypothetical protein